MKRLVRSVGTGCIAEIKTYFGVYSNDRNKSIERHGIHASSYQVHNCTVSIYLQIEY